MSIHAPESETLEHIIEEAPRARPPRTPPWLWPSVMAVLTVGSAVGAWYMPAHARLWWFMPYSFLGNSLVPFPYDPAVVYLGPHYPLWLIIVVGVIGTVVIEFWNMELLARILSRPGTHGFRGHKVTRFTLDWYRKAPFLTLVFTCVVPVIPHYPMRILATLANYPMWKYQLSVVIGRGARYAWLAALGFALKVPPGILLVLSLLFMGLMLYKMRQMNRAPAPAVTAPVAEEPR
ncbi:MAG TPA: hypothetical protein VFX50_13860 [Gemmatimonadales bacterium]|nr:hypothetical protein [Gemmatimonadales bacterium]